MLSDVEFNAQPICENCKGDKVQKAASSFGFMALYSMFFWCGLGVLIFKLTKNDYCENCHYIRFMKKAKSGKTFRLVVDDKSQLEMPPVDLNAVHKKFDKNLPIV